MNRDKNRVLLTMPQRLWLSFAAVVLWLAIPLVLENGFLSERSFLGFAAAVIVSGAVLSILKSVSEEKKGGVRGALIGGAFLVGYLFTRTVLVCTGLLAGGQPALFSLSVLLDSMLLVGGLYLIWR